MTDTKAASIDTSSTPPPPPGDGAGNDEPLKLRDSEPVTVISSVINGFKTLVLAVIALALAFNWVNWSDQQNAAVLGVVAAVFVIVSSLASASLRQKVTPVKRPRAADGSELKTIAEMMSIK